MRAYARVAETLRIAGIDTIFGLMGDANLHHAVSFIDEQHGRFVAALNEGGAVSMADGFARTTGRIGVASVTHGPGFTNTLTALTEAVRAHSQVLVVTGDAPAVADHLQRLDLRAATAITGAEYVRIHNAASVADQMWEALAQVVATSTPVVVDVPVDLAMLEGSTEGKPRELEVPASVPASKELDRALGIIATARRPVILAGRGAVLADSRDELLRLAETIGAPLATSLLARGFFANCPYDLGIAGTLGHPEAMQVILDSDCLLVFGAGLNRFTSLDGALLEGRPVVRVDRDRRSIAKLGFVEAGLAGDAKESARIMNSMLVGIEHVSSRWREQRMLTVNLERPKPRDFDNGQTDNAIDLRAAMLTLDASLPPDRIVVTDTGRFIYPTWRYLDVDEPRDFIHTLNFASIGLGLATAIGVALAHPDRMTVAVVGDGGGMMAMGELTTAVREALPLLVIVANDAAYGMEYRNLVMAGLNPDHSRSQWLGFAEVARGYGATAHTVRTIAELEQVLQNLEPVPAGPIVLDIKTDPEVDFGE